MIAAIDWDAIRNALWQWFSETSGVETIWSNQSSPQPSYPYASILITAGSIALGARDEQRWDDDGNLILIGQRDFMLSCQIHVGQRDALNGRCNAHSRMATVIASLALPKYQYLLAGVGLSIRERGNPQTLDLLVGTEWTNRVQADFRFGVASVLDASDFEDTGYFDKVEVSSDLEPLQGGGGLNLDGEILDPNA